MGVAAHCHTTPFLPHPPRRSLRVIVYALSGRIEGYTMRRSSGGERALNKQSRPQPRPVIPLAQFHSPCPSHPRPHPSHFRQHPLQHVHSRSNSTPGSTYIWSWCRYDVPPRQSPRFAAHFCPSTRPLTPTSPARYPPIVVGHTSRSFLFAPDCYICRDDRSARRQRRHAPARGGRGI